LLALDQDVSEWSDMTTQTVVSVGYHYKVPTKHVDLVQSRHQHVNE